MVGGSSSRCPDSTRANTDSSSRRPASGSIRSRPSPVHVAGAHSITNVLVPPVDGYPYAHTQPASVRSNANVNASSTFDVPSQM